MILPMETGAECDGVICACTCKSASRVVVGVTIRLRAGTLEHLRVHGRLARCWRVILAAAAVLGLPKCLAGAPASTAALRPQLRRALPIQVRDTPCRRALP